MNLLVSSLKARISVGRWIWLLALPVTLLPLPALAAEVLTGGDDPFPAPRNATTTVGDAFGDEANAPTEFRLLIQSRYGYTALDSTRARERELAQDPDGWVLNRAMLRITAKPIPQVSAKMLLDFAALRDGDEVQTVKLAYAQVELHPRVQVLAGIFKRPFSLLEMLPIGENEFGDNGRTDGLIKDVGMAGRDVGVMVQILPLSRKKLLRLSLAAFQGGQAGVAAQVTGLLAARVESRPWKHLNLGADVVWRRKESTEDLDTADGPQTPGLAWSVDAMFDWKQLDLRAEVLGGDRTDLDNRMNTQFGGPALNYLGAWFLALYRVPIAKSALMPGVRVEWLDSDRQHSVGQHLALSGVVNVDFDPRLRLLVDVTHQWVQDGTPPLGKKPAGDEVNGVFVPYADVDFTRLVVQLQVRL